jgi:hypothetical protein
MKNLLALIGAFFVVSYFMDKVKVRKLPEPESKIEAVVDSGKIVKDVQELAARAMEAAKSIAVM